MTIPLRGIPEIEEMLAVKSTDQSVTSSTTLVDDADLQFAIGASETWVYEFMLDVAQVSASGIKLTLVGPSGATGTVREIAGGNQVQGFGSSAALGSTLATTFSSTTIQAIHVMGWVVNSTTPGTVKLQWAQFASGGVATTVKAGSFAVSRRSA